MRACVCVCVCEREREREREEEEEESQLVRLFEISFVVVVVCLDS